jgi:hypothetical protein
VYYRSQVTVLGGNLISARTTNLQGRYEVFSIKSGVRSIVVVDSTGTLVLVEVVL